MKENVRFKDEKNRAIFIKELQNGRKLEIHSSVDFGYAVGDKVTIDGTFPKDGAYALSKFEYINIKHGKVHYE